MKTIGILGGVASGKSLVARRLQQLGAVILDADRAGHEVLREQEVKRLAQMRWGDKIFSPDGEIDRGQLAMIVFAPPPNGPHELAYLEQISHPRITKRLKVQIDQAEANRAPAAVLDAAVMLKAGWREYCDCIVFVDTPRELRQARAAARGWSSEEFAAREAAQESLDTKRKFADVVIDNSGSVELTHAQIDRFWHSLIG